MLAGTLRHRLTISRPSAGTSDGMGGTTGASPVTIATVWADLKSLSARERDLAKSVESERTHTVVMRYRSDVDEVCTVTEASSGRAFRITGMLDPDGRRRELTLSCVEVASDAGAPS